MYKETSDEGIRALVANLGDASLSEESCYTSESSGLSSAGSTPESVASTTIEERNNPLHVRPIGCMQAECLSSANRSIQPSPQKKSQRKAYKELSGANKLYCSLEDAWLESSGSNGQIKFTCCWCDILGEGTYNFNSIIFMAIATTRFVGTCITHVASAAHKDADYHYRVSNLYKQVNGCGSWLPVFAKPFVQELHEPRRYPAVVIPPEDVSAIARMEHPPRGVGHVAHNKLKTLVNEPVMLQNIEAAIQDPAKEMAFSLEFMRCAKARKIIKVSQYIDKYNSQIIVCKTMFSPDTTTRLQRICQQAGDFENPTLFVGSTVCSLPNARWQLRTHGQGCPYFDNGSYITGREPTRRLYSIFHNIICDLNGGEFRVSFGLKSWPTLVKFNIPLDGTWVISGKTPHIPWSKLWVKPFKTKVLPFLFALNWEVLKNVKGHTGAQCAWYEEEGIRRDIIHVQLDVNPDKTKEFCTVYIYSIGPVTLDVSSRIFSRKEKGEPWEPINIAGYDVRVFIRVKPSFFKL
jgi:hypothetical protein